MPMHLCCNDAVETCRKDLMERIKELEQEMEYFIEVVPLPDFQTAIVFKERFKKLLEKD